MNSIQETSKSKISEYLWTTLWVLFGISLFTSKSGISLFGTVLLLWSIFKIDWKLESRKNPWFLIIIGFFPLAIIASALSLGGWESSLNVIKSWSWPLYVIPFSVLFKDHRTLKAFGWALGIGLLLGCVKAFETFGIKYGYVIQPGGKVQSFWDIGRWGVFLSCSCVVLFALLGNAKIWSKANRVERGAIAVLLILALAFSILANTRGPWLASLLGIGLLGISGKRYFKCLIGVLVVVAITWAMVPGQLDRFKSSFSVKKENGVITSSDGSNAARFHMWKVNSQFFKEQPIFGTGFEAAEKPLRDFISRQGEEYHQKYIDSEFSFNDQHNSYLWILVQLGFVFFVLFFGVVGIILFKAILPFFKTESFLYKMAFALVLNQLFVFIFYSSVSSYETLWFFPVLWLLTEGEREL